MIGLLILAAAITRSDQVFVEQARRCGIKPSQIVWIRNASGQPHPSITPAGNMDDLAFSAIKCMLEWSQRMGGKFGFISQPSSAH